MPSAKEIGELVLHGLLGAGAGATGDDYVAKLMAQIEAANREKVREAQLKVQQEEREYQRGRDYKADFSRVVDELTPELAALGQPTSPISFDPASGMPELSPDFTPGYMGEAPDDLRAFAETLMPGNANAVIDAARGKAGRALSYEESSFQRDLGRKVVETEHLNQVARDDARTSFTELSDIRQLERDEEFQDFTKRSDYSHRQNTAERAYSAALGDKPNRASVISSAEGYAFSYATRLRDYVRGVPASRSSQSDWEDTIVNHMEKYFSDTLSAGEIRNIAGKAVQSRYPDAAELMEINAGLSVAPQGAARAAALKRFGN